MIGRGALGNPWLFRQLTGGPSPEPEERAALVRRHLREHLQFQAEGRVRKEGAPSGPLHDEVMGVKSFRSHLAWYAHGLHGAAAFRARVNVVTRADEVEAMVEAFFRQARVDARAADTEMEEVDYRAALG